MSDTPRSNALKRQQFGDTFAADSDPFVVLSRTLERELSACRRDLAAEERGTANLNICLDASRAECQRLREALENIVIIARAQYHEIDALARVRNTARAALQEVQP